MSNLSTSLAKSKFHQEGDTGIINLQDEDETLVQVMIDYLYTEELTIIKSAKFSEKKGKTCGHGGNDHSCTDQTCCLWPFGFPIAMYAMGDKYDVPGLRKYSHAYLRKVYDVTTTDSWADDVKIFEFAYQQSHKHDELRSWLIEKTCEGFYQRLGGHFVDQVPEFWPFLERSPELVIPLLKDSLQYYNRDREHTGENSPGLLGQ